RLGYATTGDDDGDVLLPHADDLSLGVHLPDREHAARDSVRDVPDPPPLLPGHRAWHLSQRDRTRATVARRAGHDGMGSGRAGAGGRAEPEDVWVIVSEWRGVTGEGSRKWNQSSRPRLTAYFTMTR